MTIDDKETVDNTVDFIKTVVGVRFRNRGKVYSFQTGDCDVVQGNQVIVDTEMGLSLGVVATPPRCIDESRIHTALRPVMRKATEKDLAVAVKNSELEKKAFTFCCEKIEKHDLSMKLVDVEYLFDQSKIIFYFTAENRVDFRNLVKDLVQKYKTRIELRQIWVRSEARIYGGVGICGRELCCVKFLKNFTPVSIKMVKEQNMLLNPEKISGVCGRLMCCLSYEYDTYVEAKRNMPKCGKYVTIPEGRGKVVRQMPLEEKIVVNVEEKGEVEASVHDIVDRS